MRTTGRKVSTLALAAALSVALSACGMFRDDETVTTSEAGTTTTEPTTAQRTPTTVGQMEPVQPAPQTEQEFQRSLQK